MNQMHMPDTASPLLDHCPPTLPAECYFDPDWFACEQKLIWSRQWVYVGRFNDLPEMTMRRISVAGENLILIRDRDDNVTCFHNTCRHRGSELCTAQQKQLSSKLISCPYHQWSYGFDGRLVSTPFISLTDDFRKEDHGLFRVAVKLWNGFLYVCLADDPPDFDAAPDLGPHAFDNWPMARLVTGHVMTKELACNWKIFWENYNECLHCPGIHPELSDMVPIYSRGYMAPNEAPGWTPEANHDQHVLKQGARTWSMNGQTCGPEFEGLTNAERAAGQTFVTLLPTMFVVAHVDYVRTVALRPLGPERTELRAEWLFSPETLAQPDFDLANVVDFATTVMLQDGDACEMNQRGLRSSKYRQGRLMPQEFDVFRFQQWIREQMK
ncbi:aromatic ring-hydroxylating dioxygenase subunit alpha [Rhizobium sp. KVB221]|uniref:Aromatic ring-hydroxylating dioxygenase subunit alpha n=1 Tax=Rhizobium setariae TaxID=2801340 RepID=A0A937CNP1_9HYPH|nr:aromatic ring-hydroxylating dioxygenase subunit alpha [Rhizobium setariae]MBL0372204.1 aromatic ring-hydroxylating dioxygenase subunit alpha [Rhizobium setariae]